MTDAQAETIDLTPWLVEARKDVDSAAHSIRLLDLSPEKRWAARYHVEALKRIVDDHELRALHGADMKEAAQ